MSNSARFLVYRALSFVDTMTSGIWKGSYDLTFKVLHKNEFLFKKITKQSYVCNFSNFKYAKIIIVYKLI